MLQTDLLPPAHADLVSHLVYDFYGERLATCSADQRVKVFHKDEFGKWSQEADWKAHDAPILRLSFSHPIHGSLLASSSHDRTVRIWEESTSLPPSSSSSAPAPGSVRWVERGILTGAKGAVRGVEFGPPDPAFGLRVAFMGTDGYLRVHTSLDPSLNDWSEAHKIHIPSLPAPHSTSSSDDANPFSSSSESAATPSSELALGGWGLSWCKERWWGSLIATFAGSSPVIKIISLEPTPTSILHLTPSSSSSFPSSSSSSSSAPPAPLTALSWAPNCGKNYHLLATGSRDGSIRIWRLEPPGERARVDFTAEGSEAGGDVVREWRGECTAEFGKGGARVGSVDWNATGTMLSTTDDEGVVRIYKRVSFSPLPSSPIFPTPLLFVLVTQY
ncbi:nucleoporin SEH1 [Cryptococcus wingfieldii CBS 7118]|uniref:Nucleoporin SEH1 n=1 Tax=Cryptococcus wingfieldii CBS 7118 TaxID=1295528 RepID=A0A1E3IB65_9TREE|nr:nucleoporin SEH1 [Cryptococcus wingfieldii CBS 7118]ODN85854.1 nucleoporin SEH1 [Cryptococcus wingfieldii CBS 7118]